jgi:hypothetical protein
MKVLTKQLYLFSNLPKWATVDPYTFNGSKPHTVKNILDGKIMSYNNHVSIPDPMNGE